MKTSGETPEIIADVEQKAKSLVRQSNPGAAKYIKGYKGVAVYMCLWTPPEMLRAGGYHPIMLRVGSYFGQSDRCIVRQALEMLSENTQSLDVKLLVLADSCGALLKSAFRASHKTSIKLFYFQEPMQQTDETLRRYIHQLDWLKDTVSEGLSELEFEQRLFDSFHIYGNLRMKLADIRTLELVSGSTYYLLAAAAQYAAPEDVIPLLDAVLDEAGNLGAQSGVPLLLMGGMPNVPEYWMALATEAAGGRIVNDILCTTIERTTADPSSADLSSFEAIGIEHFNKHTCLALQGPTGFYAEVQRIIEESEIRGILLYQQDKCAGNARERERMQWSTSVPIFTIENTFLDISLAEKTARLREFIDGL